MDPKTKRKLDIAYATTAGATASYMGYKALQAYKKSKCKRQFPNDRAKYNNCMNK